MVAMLKAPRPGQVKTRLGAEIGPGPAAELYRRMAAQQVDSVPREWRTEVHFSPADAREEMEAWLGPTPAFHPQVEGDLGRRLTGAVSGAFERGASAVVVVGGDCPDLDEDCLRRTLAALQEVDVVLGPAVDGGYYLIALRQDQPRLFDRIPWSTVNVRAETMQRIAEAGLRHVLLEPKEDVDDLAGLRRILTRRPHWSPTLHERPSAPSVRPSPTPRS